MLWGEKPYYSLDYYLKQTFGSKTYKASLDAGFTCPNRDGSKAVGGCTYCNNQSFSPGYGGKQRSVSDQLRDGIAFFSYKYPEMKYLAYFQSYTNTYDSIEKLIELYEEALSYPNVVGLIIGTRPDCMPDELLDYFAELNKRTFLIIEYGLESTLDSTLEFINRGHTHQESEEAILKTAAKGIGITLYLICAFRRKMLASGQLEDTGDKLRVGRNRPATVYRYTMDVLRQSTWSDARDRHDFDVRETQDDVLSALTTI